MNFGCFRIENKWRVLWVFIGKQRECHKKDKKHMQPVKLRLVTMRDGSGGSNWWWIPCPGVSSHYALSPLRNEIRRAHRKQKWASERIYQILVARQIPRSTAGALSTNQCGGRRKKASLKNPARGTWCIFPSTAFSFHFNPRQHTKLTLYRIFSHNMLFSFIKFVLIVQQS